MSVIRVAGIDPSLTATGLVKFDLDTRTMNLELIGINLIETEGRVTKQVRQNSDDLRRAVEITKGINAWLADCKICFGEIPTGAQSARATLAFGIVLGIFAGLSIPLVQVQPFETKLATVGTKTASKEEMIEWAVETYQEADWLRHNHKGVQRLTSKNEHMADACAIVHAGIKTNEFVQSTKMLNSLFFEA
jgi:Holliday junction resolvasome RuvABC endonuclease subunit